ncbi:hypothetical protein ABMA28_003017 [Loxostege sticticalis]|uniref:Protein NRDE2 homolog n=1 Tax=Loxostege sticticalis TaxID=481309 RepID=A0ABD0SYV5_LOXSC
MSLFPAYSQDDAETHLEIQLKHELSPGAELSPACEASLLASDEESPARPPPPSPPPPPSFRDDFYLDPKSDYGNLRVSTLYYPGRPQYASRSEVLALGAGRPERRARRKRRYWEARGPEPRALDDELAPRLQAFRAMLADAPTDVQLWLKFIRFQEQCSGVGAALEVATDACARAAHAALRRERHRLARHHLPAHQYTATLRDAIAAEKSVGRRAELWLFLLEALAAAPASCSAHALGAAAAAAAHDSAALPHAYPHILHAYGSFLRAAGLWELLVLLMELVASMSFPPNDAFPPPEDEARTAAAEQRLLRIEDEVCASGLPLAARWVRVERARASAHWRAPRHASADPQRAPLAADVTDLLLPVAGPDAAFLLVTQLLRLAKVPMLPGGEYVRRAFSCGAAEAVDDCAEALLGVTRAARRLPPAHPARAPPGAAARLLALLADPPHYMHHEAGFLQWVQALWAASCAWVTGERRVALLCWRLRWMHSMALLLDTQDEHGREEMRRIRNEAKSLVRAAAVASPLPFAQLARIERAAAGPAAGAAAAARAARAALRDPDVTVEQRLYVARVAAELSAEHAPGVWAVVCAVLGRALPADAELRAAPPAALVQRALGIVQQRCRELEDEYAASKEDEEISGGARVLAALLPGAGEWAAARALLASPAERHRLFQRAVAAPPDPTQSWAAARYWEQAACALAATAPAHHSLAAYARRLAARHPANALLALGRKNWRLEGFPNALHRIVATAPASGGTAWAAGGPADGADADALRRTEPGALAELLPPLLRAVQAWGSGSSASAAVASRVALRTSRRVARAGGAGASAWAALIEAAARADSAALTPLHALLAATDACPAHKVTQRTQRSTLT